MGITNNKLTVNGTKSEALQNYKHFMQNPKRLPKAERPPEY